jgi:two-component system, chemotaxis family, CheB/CheR fusion protein
MPQRKTKKAKALAKTRSGAIGQNSPRRVRASVTDTAPSSEPGSAEQSLPIVAVGASAGGIEAFEAFFRAMPPRNGMGFVVLAHLDPQRESMLPSILSRWTEMPVVAARDNLQVTRNKVFVIPANAVMTIEGGRLRLRQRRNVGERMPLDTFFTSLAEDQGESAVAIVLSGSGTDGSLGIKAVKEHGGLTLAQGGDGTEARFKEMPESAAATGLVDLLLPPEQMADRLLAYIRDGGHLPTTPETKSARDAAALRLIYSLLRSRIGHDFSRYKDRTFLRRVQRRMQVLQVGTMDEYAQALQQHRGEAAKLFRDLLIGVTSFFRDRNAFEALAQFLPRFFDGKGADDTVRVWVPGCATGEEAYSLAMLLHEHADKLQTAPKIQVFASDIDDNALNVARSGSYPALLVKDIPAARLNRFFVRDATTYHVAKELRDSCIFSSHSLIRDPPFSRLDLISCRNFLIYLDPELQSQIIPQFHYALRPGGLLFLGTSETVSRHTDLFSPLDKKWRIFERQNLVSRSIVAFSTPGAGRYPELNRLLPAAAPDSGTVLATLLRRIATIVTENFAPAYVVVNKDGEVVYYSSRTGRYLEPAEGPPNRDLVTMARKGLRLDLRTALHRARESGETTSVERVPVQVNGGSQLVKLTVLPVSEGGETLYVVLFSDVDEFKPRGDQSTTEPLDDDNAKIQQLERELQATRERLQSTVEEFETSGEELKSSNEELLSVNEELQSANEELETSKEEIQSINEELQTVNAELASKVDELDRANADLRNLFESTQVATVILDQELRVRSFTPAIEGIFNLIASDRGRPLADIVHRIDGRDIHRDLRTAIERGQSAERRVTAQNGTYHYLMRIVPYRMLDKNVNGALVTFTDISNVIRSEKREKALISELNHSVRNVLSAVISLATNMLKRSTSLDSFSGELLERLRALARTQDILSETNWIDTPLQKLIAAELDPYTGAGHRRARIRGPEISLLPKAALTLGMGIHELATNAAKHGALSAPAGRVEVTWSLKATRMGQMLELLWNESGGPPVPKGKKPLAFGLDFVERELRIELGAKTKLEFRHAGLRCTIRLPVAGNVGPSERGTD